MEIMKRRVLAAFLAMMLTCGVAFPGNAVYAAEVTETTAESDAAVEETAAQTTDAEAEAKQEGSTDERGRRCGCRKSDREYEVRSFRQVRRQSDMEL